MLVAAGSLDATAGLLTTRGFGAGPVLLRAQLVWCYVVNPTAQVSRVELMSRGIPLAVGRPSWL